MKIHSTFPQIQPILFIVPSDTASHNEKLAKVTNQKGLLQKIIFEMGSDPRYFMLKFRS